MASTKQKIVLTGLACIHPMGNDLETCNDFLLQNRPNAAPQTWYDYCFGEHPVGRIPEDYFGQQLTPMELRSFDRITMVVCDTVGQCIEGAGLLDQPEMIAETGIISGSAFGCLESQDRLRKVLKEKGPAYFDPVEFPLTSHNFPISAAAIKFGLKGPITAMISSMSSGLNALIYSAYQIIKGQTQRMMAIAFDEITELQYAYLKEKNYLECATHNNPDQSRKPVHLSECCIAWMLESVESARQRGAKIYAQLDNWHICAGQYADTDINTLYRNIMAVISEGGSIRPDSMTFVTNGSGFWHDDDAENRVLAKLVKAGVNFKECVWLKPYIGNCMGAASLMEGALLVHQQNLISRYQDTPVDKPPPAFLLNSFGMGSNLICLTMQSIPSADMPIRHQFQRSAQ